MIPRQKELFKNIVEEYVKTAAPVGSQLIVDKYHLDISSATVRNDMAELEEQGLIAQPHTSAGRIPTEYGYQYFVENYVNMRKELSKREQEEINEGIKSIKSNRGNKSNEEEVKLLAKILADKSGSGVFVGFAPRDVYYTGLTNIFSQPEFRNLALIYNLSVVIDRLDEVMAEIYDIINETEIKIGRQNPFAPDCAAVMTKVKNVIMGIVGPMRMDYERNVALINFARNIKNILY